MTGLSCIFPVLDIDKTSDFYVNKLGFKKVEYLNTAEPHICLYRDKIEIILLKSNKKVIPNRDLYGYGYDAYIYTSRQSELFEEFFRHNVQIVKKLSLYRL